MTDPDPDHVQPRPRDLALMHLAAGGEPPRERARDQRADLIGGQLGRRVFDRLAALDPDPAELETALARIVLELGEPTGPTRALCALIRQEWETALYCPGFWPWLVSEALAGSQYEVEQGGRRRRESDLIP
jgi:hypothetical protein